MATKADLKKELDKRGVEYKASATKAELENLLDTPSEAAPTTLKKPRNAADWAARQVK